MPLSVQSLELPRYALSTFTNMGMIIDEKSDLASEDEFDGATAGEDGMGALPAQGVWDDLREVAEKEDEDDGLQGDEIEDWD